MTLSVAESRGVTLWACRQVLLLLKMLLLLMLLLHMLLLAVHHHRRGCCRDVTGKEIRMSMVEDLAGVCFLLYMVVRT